MNIANLGKNSSRLDTTGWTRGIHQELCKKLKFDHSTKCYMQNLESVLDNGTLKIVRDFEIETDEQNPVRRYDLMIINKKEKNGKEKKTEIVAFAILGDHRVKIKENEKTDPENKRIYRTWKWQWFQL